MTTDLIMRGNVRTQQQQLVCKSQIIPVLRGWKKSCYFCAQKSPDPLISGLDFSGSKITMISGSMVTVDGFFFLRRRSSLKSEIIAENIPHNCWSTAS